LPKSLATAILQNHAKLKGHNASLDADGGKNNSDRCLMRAKTAAEIAGELDRTRQAPWHWMLQVT
jgi:hypothetical protein